MLNQLQTSKERGSLAFERMPGVERPKSAIVKNSRRDYTPKRPMSSIKRSISPTIVSLNQPNTVDSIRRTRPKSAYEVKSARLKQFGKLIEKVPPTSRPTLRRPTSAQTLNKKVREECVYCGDATFKSVYFCPNCKRIPYCSVSCQRMHWDRIHYLDCPNTFVSKVFS
mmetsp:Transcript_6849/g.10007  ORF Transcript_6849/g.10007 Transcript_6849/m.10007 type:complete len:168 (-) Transcript_6849:2013-2516(-)